MALRVAAAVHLHGRRGAVICWRLPLQRWGVVWRSPWVHPRVGFTARSVFASAGWSPCSVGLRGFTPLGSIAPPVPEVVGGDFFRTPPSGGGGEAPEALPSIGDCLVRRSCNSTVAAAPPFIGDDLCSAGALFRGVRASARSSRCRHLLTAAFGGDRALTRSSRRRHFDGGLCSAGALFSATVH